MRRFRSSLLSFLLTALLTLMLAGCGGGGGSDSPQPAPQTDSEVPPTPPPPPPPQTGDTSLFPNAELLVSVQDLDTPSTIVLDARHSVDAYNAGHIPGAIYTPPDLFSTKHILRPVAELEQVLGGLGITRTSKIIIYDDTTASLGAGGRLFWLLEYLGCTNVSILNGGWDQWEIQRMPVTTVVPPPLPPAVFTALVNDAIYVTKEYVASRLNALDFTLVDVRTDLEYQGLLPNDDPRLGHIPGAISFPYTECYNSDKTVLNFNDLKLLLQSKGITTANEVVAYSTVGKRSAFFYFLFRLMDYTNVANYDGSILEWGSSDPVLYPMVTGPL